MEDAEILALLERTVQNQPVAIYLRGDNIYEAFWSMEAGDYALSYRGWEGMTEAEFLEVLEHLVVTEDPSPMLTQ